MFPERVVDRVLARWVEVDGCWISTYSIGSHGYAQVGWVQDGHRTMALAHRVSWWATHRELIPEGMTVDHSCHVRRCVNPAHLRLLPNPVNATDNGSALRKTNVLVGSLCYKGHPKAREAKSGRLYCRECKNERERRTRRGPNRPRR